MRYRFSGILTGPIQTGLYSHRTARGLKFRIKKVEGLYYQCSENKDADQLRGNIAKAGFLMTRIKSGKLVYNIKATLINEPRYEKICPGFPTRSDTKQDMQSQEMDKIIIWKAQRVPQ